MILAASFGLMRLGLGAKIKPSASAPASTAAIASSRLVVPQILIHISGLAQAAARLQPAIPATPGPGQAPSSTTRQSGRRRNPPRATAADVPWYGYRFQRPSLRLAGCPQPAAAPSR